MSKRLGTLVALTAVLTTQAGCYTTKIVSQARPASPEYTDRQWFTLGGLVPLSGPAGRECEDGLATAESKLSGTDWLINVGLSIAGGIVGGAVCGAGAASSTNGDPQATGIGSTVCATGIATLVPFLIGSRTVKYTCAEGGGRGGGRDFMPPPPPPPAANMPPSAP